MKILMLLLLVCISGVFSTNPGFKARITQNGLSYANKVAIAVLAKQVKSLKIPDQSGEASHVSYTISNIQITSFTPPTSSMQLQARTGIKWTASGASMSITGDYKYKFKKAFIHISDHGRIDGSVSGLSFSINIKLSDVGGKPHIVGSGCSCNIGSVKIHFHGGASWIYNLFDHVIEGKVKNILKSKMCDILGSAINKNANDELAKLPMSVVMEKMFLLDYSLISNPVFQTKYMETAHKGEIFWKGDTKECPFTPAPLPDTPDVSRMLYLWLSDYMANSLAYVGFKHGFLKYNLTAKDLPPSDRDLLNTTCSLKCIGKLIPQIGKKYPNSQVMLAMHATGVPEIHIQKGFINMNFTGDVDLYARTPKGKAPFLLTIVTGFQATVDAAIDGQLLKGQIKSTNLQVSVKNSQVGPVSSSILQLVMNTAIKFFVVPQLNSEGQKGLVLPVTDDIHFSKAQLSLLQGALLISTDLLYVPKFSIQSEGETFQSDHLDTNMNFQVVGDKMREFPQI